MLTRLLSKFKKNAKATIFPQSLTLPKDRFDRDENHYHYRYPSPGSIPIDQENDLNAYDYRTGYKDSVHDIRPFEHDPVTYRELEEYVIIQPELDSKKRDEGGIISNQEES